MTTVFAPTAAVPAASLLPPPHTRARTAAVALIFFAPLAFGLLALLLGPDASWDLRNYHWYNAWAFLTGRTESGIDFMPSQGEFFLNPLSDVPFYWLATHLPLRAAGFILGAVQGLNFPLLFLLSYRCLGPGDPARKTALCAGLAALGVFSAIGISEIGTVFQDNITSLGIFTAALLLLSRLERLLTQPGKQAAPFSLLAGIPAGAAAGLKITCLGWCIGLCLALLVATADMRRCFTLSFFFGLGVLLGLVLTDGGWAWHLYSLYGSPLFPFYNIIFRSPLLPPTELLDYATPRDLRLLVFPFFFGFDPALVNEVPWRDWRIPLLYALFLLLLGFRLLKPLLKTAVSPGAGFASPLATRFLLITAAVAYYVWLFTETVYRYLLPLDMLSPLLIVLCSGLLPGSLRLRATVAAALLGLAVLSLQPADWGRHASWPGSLVDVSRPALTDKDKTMILMAGPDAYAYILPAFPPQTSFVRIQSRGFAPADDTGLNRLIRARIAAYKGSLLLLQPAGQLPGAASALAPYGLALTGSCKKVTDNRAEAHVNIHTGAGDSYPAAYDLCDVRRLK